jgi:hypothetical protein
LTYFHLKTLNKHPYNVKEKKTDQRSKHPKICLKTQNQTKTKTSLNPDFFFWQDKGKKYPNKNSLIE